MLSDTQGGSGVRRPGCRRLFVPVLGQVARLAGSPGTHGLPAKAAWPLPAAPLTQPSIPGSRDIARDVPEGVMRDEGGGKDGLALETASCLFPQHFPAPVPQCGGGGRTIRGVPHKAAWPPACLPAATPASRPPSPAAILGPGGRTTAPSALGAAAPSCRRQRGRGRRRPGHGAVPGLRRGRPARGAPRRQLRGLLER